MTGIGYYNSLMWMQYQKRKQQSTKRVKHPCEFLLLQLLQLFDKFEGLVGLNNILKK